MDKIKTYVVDIDNTICTQTYGDYSKAKPYQDRINKINDLYDAGHKIIYFTARGMVELMMIKFYLMLFVMKKHIIN